MEITIQIGLSALRAQFAVDAITSSRTYPILGGQVRLNASELGATTDECHSILPAIPSVRWEVVGDVQLIEQSQPKSEPSELSTTTTSENVPADYQGFSIDAKLILAEMEILLGPMYLNMEKYPNIAAYLRSKWA